MREGVIGVMTSSRIRMDLTVFPDHTDTFATGTEKERLVLLMKSRKASFLAWWEKSIRKSFIYKQNGAASSVLDSSAPVTNPREHIFTSNISTGVKMQNMDTSGMAWVGSAFLFVQSTSKNIDLSSLYTDSQHKPRIFKALKITLESATFGGNANCILKVYYSDKQLIIYLKFCGQEACRSFLQSYGNGEVQQELQNQLQIALSMLAVPIQMELKVGSEKLDDMLDNEECCLQLINKEKPNRLPDEEITELEESLRNLNVKPVTSTERSQNAGQPLPPPPIRMLSLENSTFIFQDQEFANRTLTSEDHQKFSKMVGKNWKLVGRSMQKTCRALRDPVIENLAYEHDKEGLYEQAYQMLLKFIQAEGKKATLQRLVEALQDTGLTSLAEQLLNI